jgi:hypothetical protein
MTQPWSRYVRTYLKERYFIILLLSLSKTLDASPFSNHGANAARAAEALQPRARIRDEFVFIVQAQLPAGKAQNRGSAIDDASRRPRNTWNQTIAVLLDARPET